MEVATRKNLVTTKAPTEQVVKASAALRASWIQLKRRSGLCFRASETMNASPN